ncbi:hypothetical protein [Kitasatospora camelliae]|uniref:Uncharacterized protein n=1 Tax=Kitasatospora camelliae TaxID=3156397 RepID=A0AAU8K8C1_9ACTN
MTSVMDQIYQQLKSVLGGTNSNQFLSMTVPGTMLNPGDFAYDTTKVKPAVVAEAESRLVDQMFDIAEITGSGNGQHVSAQYLQALSTLVPKFDPMMPTVKNRLREFLRSPAPPDAVVDGDPFTGSTLEELYFALYDSWLRKKGAWEQQVVKQKQELTKEQFVEWYEGHAETELAAIDAAEGRLVSVFSPSDMKAILGALAAGPGGEITDAVSQVLDMRLPSPSGGYVFPIDLSPSDWFRELASDQAPVDLLDDPRFIALSLTGRRQALDATISQVKALISRMPTAGALATATAAVTTAQTEFTAAQNTLVNQYSANTVTAIDLVLAAIAPGGAATVDALDKQVAAVSSAKGESLPATKAMRANGMPLSPADLQKLLDGHQRVLDAQSKLITSAQNLADAGMNLASEQAQTFGELPVMLDRLRSQLADVTALQAQLATIAANPAPTPVPAKNVAQDEKSITAVRTIINEAESATSAATWLTRLYVIVKEADAAKPLYTTSVTAWLAFVADALTGAVNDVAHAAAEVRQAALDASNAPGATGETVKAAVGRAIEGRPTAVVPVLQTITDEIGSASAAAGALEKVDSQIKRLNAEGQSAVTAGLSAVSNAQKQAFPPAPAPPSDTVTAAIPTGITALHDYLTGATNAAAVSLAAASAAASAAAQHAKGYQESTDPSSARSQTADRWMELKFSLKSSEMTSNKSTSSLYSQTNWRTSLFLGSASGSSKPAQYQLMFRSRAACGPAPASSHRLPAAALASCKQRGWGPSGEEQPRQGAGTPPGSPRPASRPVPVVPTRQDADRGFPCSASVGRESVISPVPLSLFHPVPTG